MLGAVDDSTALLLGLLGFSATKLWNSAVWFCKEQWETTGKIPSYPDVDKQMKAVGNRWYRCLHAQSAQAVLEELGQSYKSWYGHRKKGTVGARPPGFRRKETLSTVTFKKDSVKWDDENRMLRVGIPVDVFGKKEIYLPVKLKPGLKITAESVQMARLVEHDGSWIVHLVYKIEKPEVKEGGHTMAVDLGQNVLMATACTDGSTQIYSGGELLALERYFEKEKAKCTKVSSRKRIRLEKTRSAQRNHLIHCLTKTVISDAKARGVTTIVVGDVTDIRLEKNGEAKNWGDSGNQKLHAWPHKKMLEQLIYKGAMEGIAVVTISEAYSSQDCCGCGRRHKKNRQHRGIYVCAQCGLVIHADVNGAINILKRYLPGWKAPWSSGQYLACPSVNRFAWRKTKPFVREPGTWQRSFNGVAAAVKFPLAA